MTAKTEEVKKTLRQQLAEEQQAQVDACLAEVTEVLRRHGCEMIAQPALMPDGRLTATAGIVIKPE